MRLIAISWLIVQAIICVHGQPRLDYSSVSKDGLTVDQAKQLLADVLHEKGQNLQKTGVSVELLTKKDGGPVHPGFLDFGVTYDSPSAGASEVIGAYAVSRLTGDIWETNLCRRLETRRLRAAQQAIMRRTGRTFSDERSQRLGLGCSRD